MAQLESGFCSPQQQALTFSAKHQQLSDAMLMGKQQTPPLEQSILFRSFGRQQTQSKQPITSTTMMITSLEMDETGASVAHGKKHCSRVRVDGKFRSEKKWSKCGTR